MQKLIKDLIQKNKTKILLIILDGLGGLPVNGRTELDVANKPNLDALAMKSACGLHIPVAMGITPGSIPTDKNRTITGGLQEKIKKIDNVEIIFAPGMEHRFAVVLRFPERLPQGSALIKDTDPQKEGMMPVPVTPETPQAEQVTRIVEKLISNILDIIKNEPRANFILLRGFSQVPDIPHFEEVYGLKSLCIAVYPMYRGLARLIGMDAPVIEGDIKEEIDFLKKHYNNYDFFFLHVKKIDSYAV